MTEVLDPPANGQQQLARTDRQRMIVADSGQFQNLLDTGKFEHLWRVAQLFASSALVPEAFQNKPADCLIATQMAIRLGVDPFMFMQNTYVYKGKPGMEGKLAIALINSSGLFRGPLRYDLGGDGDARGCTAWAIDKETGERIEGPRVSIATAKAEGWYEQNKKWKTIPDLMLQYRAGSWFGRLICPERLMGMQTIEELHDVGAVAVAPVGERPVDRLNKRITARPVSEGQTFEPADDPTPPDPSGTGKAPHGDNQPAAATGAGELNKGRAGCEAPSTEDVRDNPARPAPDSAPDVPGGQAEPPPETHETTDATIAGALSGDWDSVRRVLIDNAHPDMSKSDAARAIDAHVKVKLGKGGKEDSITPARRRALYDALKDMRLAITGEIRAGGTA